MHLCVSLNDHPVSFVQTLLVLPAPCAQEMALLWACLLQTRLAAAAQLQPGSTLQQQQQQQQMALGMQMKAAAGGGSFPRGSLDVGSSVEASGWTSQDSSCSTTSLGNNSSSAGSNVQASGTAAAGVSSSSSPGVVYRQTAAAAGGGGGGGGSAVSPNEVQAVWNKQYTPLLTDIAYLLATHQHKAAMPTAGIAVPGSPALAAVAAATGQNAAAAAAAGAAAAAAGGVSIDSPQFKSMVTQLVQFLAANGMWAVLQLITDSVYGVGASAKALYTAKAAAGAAAAAAAPAAATGSSAGSSNGASVASSVTGRGGMSAGGFAAVAAAAGVPQVPVSSVQGSGSTSMSNSSNGNSSSVTAGPGSSTDADYSAAAAAAAAAIGPEAAALEPEQQQQQQRIAGDAVAAALTAAAAGQVPDFRVVMLLLLVVLQASFKRQAGRVVGALRQVWQRMTRSAGAAAVRAAGVWFVRESRLLLHGVVLVVGALCVQLLQQLFGRREVVAGEPADNALDAAVASN
jgi:hypothetical protein